MHPAMARSATVALFLLLLVLFLILAGTSRLPSNRAAEVLAPADADGSGDEDTVGTRSAVLIAGSNGYNNHQHQVKARTAVDGPYSYDLHVMQYGETDLNSEKLSLYVGSNPANDDATFINDNSLSFPETGVDNQDADLVYLWYEYLEAPQDSPQKQDALKELAEVISHRLHVDNSIELIGELLFGSEQGSNMSKDVRPEGQPFVDDWSCLKSMVRTFQMHCGCLSWYGLKHTLFMANICNAGVSVEMMAAASAQACSSFPRNRWSSIEKEFFPLRCGCSEESTC